MHWKVVRQHCLISPFPKSATEGTRVVSHDLERNRLLAVLPKPECDRWLPLLEPVDLRLGQVLHESGVTLACTMHERTGFDVHARKFGDVGA
jgi:hypothetical protein